MNIIRIVGSILLPHYIFRRHNTKLTCALAATEGSEKVSSPAACSANFRPPISAKGKILQLGYTNYLRLSFFLCFPDWNQ